MEDFWGLIRQSWADVLDYLPQLGAALALFLLFWVVGGILGRGVVRLLEQGRLTGSHKTFFRTVTKLALAALGGVIALNVLGLDKAAAGLVAGGGITAVILGFAFREIGENFLAGFSLAFSRPFEVGHLIQSGDVQGVVQGIELRSTHVRTADGRDIFIPSSMLFKQPLVNFTRDGLRRPTFTVGIAYQDDSEKARTLLLEEVRATPGVLAKPEPYVRLSGFAPQYVELEAGFWVNTFEPEINMLAVRTEVMERCRRVLVEQGFVLSADVATNVELRSPSPRP